MNNNQLASEHGNTALNKKVLYHKAPNDHLHAMFYDLYCIPCLVCLLWGTWGYLIQDLSVIIKFFFETMFCIHLKC